MWTAREAMEEVKGKALNRKWKIKGVFGEIWIRKEENWKRKGENSLRKGVHLFAINFPLFANNFPQKYIQFSPSNKNFFLVSRVEGPTGVWHSSVALQVYYTHTTSPAARLQFQNKKNNLEKSWKNCKNFKHFLLSFFCEARWVKGGTTCV